MKKVLLTLSVVALAASVFAQGTVVFNNRVTGTLITHIYLGGTTQLAGQGNTDFPAGVTDWGGFVALSGAGYSAALLSGASEASLAPAAPILTFRTGTGAGFIAGNTATLANVAKDAPSALLQVVAWDNKGGTINTWADAQTAWAAGLTAAGKSPTFTVNAIGGDFNTPPYLLGLQSFNIFMNIPEPTTMALAGLGAAAMLIFRRRR